MDRKTVVAVALCVLFLLLYRPLLHLFGWDKYLAGPPTTTATKSAPSDTGRLVLADTASAIPGGSSLGSAAHPADTSRHAGGAVASAPSGPAGLFATPPSAQLQQISGALEIETPLYLATFSNRGARLLGVTLKHYASAHGASSKHGRALRPRKGEDVPPADRVSLTGTPLFGLDLGEGDDRRDLSNVVFATRDSVDAAGRRVALTFEARDSSGAYVRQTYRVRPDSYAMDLEVEIRGVPISWRLPDYSLAVHSWPLITEADELADVRSHRATSLLGTSLHRENAARIVGKPRVFDGSAVWAAVQSRYFISAIALPSGTGRSVISSAIRRPLLQIEQQALPPGSKGETEDATNTLVVGLPSELRPIQHFTLYAGPSDFFQLSSLRLGLERAIELGWGWVRPASHALLILMKWIYGVFRNYGVAIILLATLVRVMLHPLNVAGIRNMRSMQRIQPELERIREKYKNDAQAMNTAVMALYKENKVNPAGGCLPMLVQIPVFVALYNVLFNAIELRQSPFIAWIYDLSAPDLLFNVGAFPVRLLPLVMLGSGLLSQRLTPTDPKQLPTMYMMNAFMTVFFYNLPSGLVLYWTLMNLLTSLQQWLVLRQDGAHRSEAVVVTPSEKPRRR